MADPAWIGPGWTLDSLVTIETAEEAFSWRVGTDTAFANVVDPDFGDAYEPPLGTKVYTLIEQASGVVESVYVEPAGRIVTGADLVPGVTAYTSDPVVAPPARAERGFPWGAVAAGLGLAATAVGVGVALASD